MDALPDVTSLLDLSGKVAIVTGSAEGMGHEIALLFAHAGASVVVADINTAGAKETASKITAAGRKALALTLDQSDEASVVSMVRTVREQLGRIDILVNNAALQHRALLDDFPTDVWDRLHAVNLRGPFLCIRETVKVMKADGIQGRIVNVSSVGSMHAIFDGLVGYNSAKAGVNGLTRNCSHELAPHGITVNAVLPGAVPTRGSTTSPGPPISAEVAKRAVPPLGRMGTPADIARAVLFLASPAAAFITGQTLVVDGGFLGG